MPADIKFGVELEFLAPGVEHAIGVLEQEARIDNVSHGCGDDDYKSWEVDTDGSVEDSPPIGMRRRDWEDNYDFQDNNIGVEVRTPIMRLRQRDLRDFARVVKALDDDKDIRLTRSSGMHVHISSGPDWRLDRSHLLKKIERRYRKQVWADRKGYCPYVAGGHYGSLTLVNLEDAHYEIRIFNGCLKWKTVLKRVEDVVRWYGQGLERKVSRSVRRSSLRAREKSGALAY